MLNVAAAQTIPQLVSRQRARVEGTFLRYKRILGGSLRAKGFEAQQREAMVGCTVLNKMLVLGEAQSSAVAE